MTIRTHTWMVAAVMALLAATAHAQNAKSEQKMVERLNRYFQKYKPKGTRLRQQPRMVSYDLDNQARTLTITADEYFAAQEFTPDITAHIYKKVRKELPSPYDDYELTIVSNGMTIDELIPNRLSRNVDKARLWGDIDYDGQPWVSNVSQPYKVTHGLDGRHLSLWASHGRYYDQKKGLWRWQRPNLFCTTEDLFTQTIVVPYLIPMLENAGAVVFTPRERDWQTQEVVVDNDGPRRNYIEVTRHEHWQTTPQPGFGYHQGTYGDGENPFTAGYARMAKTTGSKSRYAMATYQPDFPKEGRYAVYVSYQTVPGSIDDAHYTVWHKGEKTEFRVNQQMGGGTWVYLGTFDFDKGYSEFNRVSVTNQSDHNGLVTTDAVRFGGGMGNIQRFGQTSGMPRALEGARYYAQWAGMPYTVYSSKNGLDDYADDINVRSLMTNYVGGGSPFMPTLQGLGVPIELSLAIHSDAGYAKDAVGLIGPLSICTTKHNDGKLNAGVSRMASRDLADALLSNEVLDIKFKYGEWRRREIFDRNYSETRLPEVPSAILETMSHQNFPDMRYGQDPNFRFTLARSIYKTILRYVNDQHGKPFIVAPLTPQQFQATFSHKNELLLEWAPQTDPQEPTSVPTGYIVYTAMGDADFDNGTYVRSKTSHTLKLEPGILYHFRVAAVNRGGKSFPTETLSARYTPLAEKTILVVNGFHRLSSPAVVNADGLQGFNIDDDPGITYGPTLGWAGRQTCFDVSQMGNLDGGLGCGTEELAGRLIAGNDFNYVKTHAKAIETAGEYNIVSCSSQAVDMGMIDLTHYHMVDLLLGLERYDGHSLQFYKAFTTPMKEALQRYTRQGGALLVSGAYTATDMTLDDDRLFLNSVLKCQGGGRSQATTDDIRGLGTSFKYWKQLNAHHYAATSADILLPTGSAFTAMQYADGYGAATAYKGNDYRLFVMGFPFECIKDHRHQLSVMKGIVNFLLK